MTPFIDVNLEDGTAARIRKVAIAAVEHTPSAGRPTRGAGLQPAGTTSVYVYGDSEPFTFSDTGKLIFEMAKKAMEE